MAYTNIDDPSAHFQTLLWTGNDVDGRALTNDGNSDLQPDLVWLKNRNAGYPHFLQDSSRGTSVYLSSSTTTGDTTWTNLVESFDTNGFTVGDDGSQVPNHIGNTFVGWQWKANGGTTSSNTAGGTTTTVQANQDAGFSIVTWTGNGTTTTLGHGLGVRPDVIIQKARGTTSNWNVYHKNATNGQQPYNVITNLNLNDATGIASNTWGTVDTDITSSVFYLKYWINYNTTNLAYCFAEKQGYSKFGSYVGNGSADGTFVYTGFKPAWVMTKEIAAAGAWVMYDNKRSTTANPQDKYFSANTSDAEATFTQYDFVSNGFKFRTGGSENGSAEHIYMAFAENPFVTSTGIPTTAR